MKKRLISLLVALCMAVTLLPVSALTAAADGSGGAKLEIAQGGYPNGSNSGNTSCSGNGWSYNHTDKTLTLCPNAPTSYDFLVIHTGYSTTTNCNLIIGKNATVTNGYFIASVTNNGTITGGSFDNAVTNHGKIIGGRFDSSVTNASDGTIENGQFGNCTVTNNDGTINGGTFKDELTGSGIEPGYTLTATMPAGFDSVSVNGYGNSCYVIPNQASVSVDISYHFNPANNFQNLPPLDVAIDNAQHMLLSDWCGSNFKIEFDGFSAYEVTFTAPSAKGSTVTISPLTRLVIDKDGYPATAQDWNGNRANYTGNGWNFDASNNTLTLTSGSYDFSGEENALHPLNPNVNLVVESGAKLTGGATGDGSGVTWQLTENTDDPSTYKLTISGSGAMKDFHVSSYQPWHSFRMQITSVVILPGVTSIGECAFSWFSKLTHVDIADSVISIGWNAFRSCSSLTDITIPQSVTYIGGLAFSYCTTLTSITIPGSVTSIGSNVFDGCTRLENIYYLGTNESVINNLPADKTTLCSARVTFDYGDKVPEAERMITVSVKTGETLTAPTTPPTVSGYEFKGWRTKDGKPYDFTVAPTGKFTLYANWEKIPDPKPEPEPEAPTYTLTVKGGTFTYNGGEAMTSARVPVDAEVKVTLNQSAVPEGMVFDLWAMDEASLLGNPAVAYNEESFTIPAGSVAKGSTVTVEAQYRDATIESEPSILGTAAIIGVAGAGTAVIVWQGYRIGMELYEKYFQPTPEETAAEQPAPEAPAAAAAS